jgi:hypothetical protein
MRQPCGYSNLAQKALRLVRLRSTATREQNLDGDLAGVPEVLRQIHGRHTSVTDLLLDPISVGHGSSQTVRKGRHVLWLRSKAHHEGREETNSRRAEQRMGTVVVSRRRTTLLATYNA